MCLQDIQSASLCKLSDWVTIPAATNDMEKNLLHMTYLPDDTFSPAGPNVAGCPHVFYASLFFNSLCIMLVS